MSTVAPLAESTAPTTGAVRDAWRRGLMAAPFVPLVVAYYAHLWRLPHYQFFPFALAAAYYLARRTNVRHAEAARRARPAAVASAAGSFALLTVGVWLNSPWTAVVAALLGAAAEVLRVGGGRVLRTLAPAGLMLLATIRPPLNGDAHLVVGLQQLTTRFASRALDVLGVLHNVSGNVVEIPGRRLLVEEACSGVNSLFAVFACTLFYLLVRPRRPFVWVALLVSVPTWVLFGNVLRVASVAVLRSAWNLPVDEGAWHTALGFAVFFLSIGLVFATDQLLRFYTAVLPPDELEVADVGDSARSASSNVAAAAAPAGAPRSRGAPLLAATGVLLLLVQLPGLGPATVEWTNELRRAQLPEFGADLIPEQADGWRRTNYAMHRRERGSSFGEFSQAWTLAADDALAVFSLDYPFVGWHELTECYASQGWTIASRKVRPSATGDEGATPPGTDVVEVAMVHPQSARYGLLQFVLVRTDGRPLEPRALGEWDELRDRIAARRREGTSDDGRRAATFQLQLFVETYVEPDADQTARSHALFAAQSERVLAAIRRHTSADSGRTNTE